jgi:hypothetical protein
MGDTLCSTVWDDGVLTPGLAPETLEEYVERIAGNGGGGGGGNLFELSFTNSNLSVAGILVATHGLGFTPCAPTVYDSLGETIYPDRVEVLTNTMMAINLESFVPLQGTWKVIIHG